MLQPRRVFLFVTICLSFVDLNQGLDAINTSPRRRRENGNDVTTVLLVDNHGRSTFGRFHSVKPDLGLITSTARTFIQEGVTTEYATQVLGTTLDNGRLYAHLLTKSSRVLYDGDSNTKSYDSPNKKWTFDNSNPQVGTFVRNTDFIQPQPSDPLVVFPTISLNSFLESNKNDERARNPKEIVEDELLKESPSNNFRVSYEDNLNKHIVLPLNQQNIKVFKINPQMKDISYQNVINHKEVPEVEKFTPSKVRAWDNLPTFTVRNEFSPSGYSFLGDFPEFDVNTESSRPTTVAERKAKLLFKAGLAKPNPKDLKSITYSGFADFTTTVGDTVIIFTPHTSEVTTNAGHVTKISVEPTIEPTLTIKDPTIATTVKTFFSQEPGMETHTVEGHKLEMKTSLPTMVIDKTDRARGAKSQQIKDNEEEKQDMDAKSSVLAHEQQELISTSGGKSTVIFSDEVIQPSESQLPMLSTPSDEDIAKIFASLQAAQAKTSTEPLNKPSTIFFDEATQKPSGGATTIFFEDEVVPSTVEKTAATVEQVITTEQEPTTTEQAQTTVKQEPITEKQEPTTVKQEPTTFKQEEPTTINDITTTNEIVTDAPEEPKEEVEVVCTSGSKIVPTTAYKTLTYLTTFFIPQDNDETTTSIKSNQVVSTEMGFQTVLCPSSVTTSTEATVLVTTTENEPTTTEQLQTTINQDDEAETTPQITTTESDEDMTTPQITTERRHVTESEPETTEMTTEDGEELELLFKTLYTTYTYLTTYFQDSTSSVASRIVVTTNVITSTLDPSNMASDPAVAGLFDNDNTPIAKTKTVSFEDFANIAPSKVADVRPTKLAGQSDDDDDEVESILAKPTPSLGDDKVLQTANNIKTYYTTYTYFTTIFVDGETEISSRTEVYTNYVTPSATNAISATKLPGKTNDDIEDDEDLEGELEENVVIKNRFNNLNVTPLNKYNSTISRQKDIYTLTKDKLDNNILATNTQKDQYVTLQRTTTEDSLENNILNLSDYETISTMVTDVRSSTSEGDRRIIDIDKRNVLLDDQIVSESNNDSEIIPSPTLLVQTSYTTFTYFTTMYQGTTSSNVVSRLETVTNVVTQTLTPTHTLSVEDLSLPVTYFTTFTYWTTLYKDGTTRTTSREETVSNVVTPSIETTNGVATISITTPVLTTATEELGLTNTVEGLSPTSTEIQPSKTVVPSVVGEDDLTTFFTTYTYYTTSYVGDSTVLNSRLETVTNVLNKSNDIDSNQIGRAIGAGQQNKIVDEVKAATTESTSTIKPTGLLSTIVNTVENSGTTTILSTDVFGTYIDGLYAKVLESTSTVVTDSINPSSVATENLKPTGVVSINQGKIVDAEGVSTLFYTTQAVGTYIDNLYAQVIESTSSLTVDQEKKAALGTDIPVAHKTGLVRLIEGSIVQNGTTTLYESKVLGTEIDGRYAQIIESTSSFLVGKPTILPSSVSEIAPTPTKAPDGEIASTSIISPSPVVIEGSISDSAKPDEENTTEDNEDDEDKDGGRVKSRLSYKPKKKAFTPPIRPFASRNRPTFAPKRKVSGQSTATTVTRSDFTPTVTAVPATARRFGGGRKSSNVNNVVVPTASGARRFAGRKSSTATAGGASSSFGGGANGRRSSARIQPTATGFGSSSTRRAGFRSSSAAPGRANSLFPSSSRNRIRPTASLNLNRAAKTKTVTQPSAEGEDNELTTSVTDPTDVTGSDADTTLPISTTTEGTRRQNPLLKFRRPPLARATPAPKTGGTTAAKGRGGNLNKAAKTTTTAKPKTTLNRGNSLLNRPRPNALFPRRGLFTTTTTAAPEEEEEEEEGDDLEEEVEDGDNEDDTDYDASKINTQTAAPATTPATRQGRASLVRPIVGFRRRSKRETNYSRFRRPGSKASKTTAAPVEEEPQTEAPKSTRNRYSPKFRTKNQQQTTTAAPAAQRKRISPSKPNSSRSQFTLRDKDSSSRQSVKRPTRPRTSSSSPTRKSSSRRNNYQADSPSRNTQTRQSSRTSSNRRGNNSYRRNQESTIDENFIVPQFDGTITVTHQIPTEVTIPVVNGKITEYKNVVTAKYSTEVLDPRQYSTTLNSIGKEVKVLFSENTEVNPNGATLITQFVLNESPTTSVIFTPTYIRGRKTSFSHVIPSTVYAVEQVVNTIQPALAAQAPLANILLSQLLLGGIPQNPLLALQNPAAAIGGVQATPSTEFKTKATTYVTTVTSSTSTVIPLTFRGKEILTTIIDSSVTVVTATEYLTETVVVTPTLNPLAALAPNPQLNTLLLPLLQQQLAQPQNLLSQPNQFLQQPAGVLALNEPRAEALISEDENLNLALDEVEQVVTPAPRRKNRKKHHKKPAPTEPPKETSVITLYVSGRTPGEFSTVLSTVIVGEENNKRKREANYIPIAASHTLDDLIVSTLDYYDTYVMPATNTNSQIVDTNAETQSLESIIGDVSKHITSKTSDYFNAKPTKSAHASKKYKLKYVKASDTSSKSGNFLV